EGLGLPELSSFIQQRFEFAYTLGSSALFLYYINGYCS
ncbi:unnamed protein product, partial [marine sediment metagenome]